MKRSKTLFWFLTLLHGAVVILVSRSERRAREVLKQPSLCVFIGLGLKYCFLCVFIGFGDGYSERKLEMMTRVWQAGGRMSRTLTLHLG